MLVNARSFAATTVLLYALMPASLFAACSLAQADLDGISTQLAGGNAKAAAKAMTTLTAAAHQAGGAECVSATLDALLIVKSQDKAPAPLRTQAQQLVAEFTQSGKVAPALFPGLLKAAGSADVSVSSESLTFIGDYLDYGAEDDVASAEPLLLEILSNKEAPESKRVPAGKGIGAEVRRKLRRNSVFPAVQQILSSGSFGAVAAGTSLTTALASYPDGYEVLADACSQAPVPSTIRTVCNAAFKGSYQRNVIPDGVLQGRIDGLLTQFAGAPLMMPAKSCPDTDAAAELAAQMGIKAAGLKAVLEKVAAGTECGQEASKRALAAMH